MRSLRLRLRRTWPVPLQVWQRSLMILPSPWQVGQVRTVTMKPRPCAPGPNPYRWDRSGAGCRALAPVPPQAIAVFVAEEVNRLLAAESRLFKGDGDAVLQVVALNGAGPARTAAHAAKEGIENAFKAAHAAKAAEIKPALLRRRPFCGPSKPNMVVAFALFGVAEDLIGLVELLEALLGVFVVGVQVGMAFLGFFAVRALISASEASLLTPSTS